MPGRVAKALLDLSERLAARRRRHLVSHDLTQEELAQLVGASRETVNKALADFAARGWCGSRPGPCCCRTSSASSAAPADRPLRPAATHAPPPPGHIRLIRVNSV